MTRARWKGPTRDRVGRGGWRPSQGPAQALLALALLACKGDPERAPLAFVQLSVPLTTSCLAEAELLFEGSVPADYAGLPARLEGADGVLAEGEVGVEGAGSARLALRVGWNPARGPVRGALTVGDQTVDVELRVEVEGPAPPEIGVFGLFDGDEVLGPDAIAALAVDAPWDGAVSTGQAGQLVVGATDPRAPHGAPTTLELFACAEDGGDCALLGSQVDPSFGEIGARALLDPVADATCAALPARVRSRLVAVATNACGDDEVELSARVVHDDCDGDGALQAVDCDDEEGGVVALGDVAADGLAVASLAEAVGAADIAVCGGEHAGGLVFGDDAVVRSVGPVARLTAPATGSTVRVEQGAVVELERLSIDAGPGSPVTPGVLGGAAVNARDAGGLVLREVDLEGGVVGLGGALVGPSNGNFDAVGGAWVGGTAADGGVALLSGGRLDGVEVREGTATGRGGGIAVRDGDFEAVDCSFVGGVAAVGGALSVERGSARLSGVRFLGGSAVDGGCVGATLDAGFVLDLRPSIVNLDPTEFVGCAASDRGGAVFVDDGSMASVLVEVDGGSAARGGAFALVDVGWSDAASAVDGPSADEGSVAWISGGTSLITAAAWSDGDGPGGGLHVAGGASVDVQNGTFDGFECAVQVMDGEVELSGVTTGANDADVCGAGWTADFAPGTCDPTGC